MKLSFAGAGAALAIVLGVGCGSGFEDAANEVEGIYQVSAYTRNEAACTPGGESRLGDDTFAFATVQTVFNIEVLTIMSCASPADCRAKLAKLEAFELFPIDFSFSLSDAEGDVLTGEGASTGFSDNGLCKEGELTRTRLSHGATDMRIEQEVTLADDYPVDGSGFCTSTGAAEAAEGNPCSQLELLTAELVERL